MTTAVLLCFGPFLLSRFVSGSEVSAVLTVVGAPNAEQVANGLPIEGKYPAVFAEEDKGRDGVPKNAVLLSTTVVDRDVLWHHALFDGGA